MVGLWRVVGWLDGEAWDGLRAAVPPLLIDRQCQDKTTTEHLSWVLLVPTDLSPGSLSFQRICPALFLAVQVEGNIGKMGRFENIRQSRTAEDIFKYFYVL